LFENRVARLFLKASPSVTEMALIGRIALMAEKYGADGPVIVDLHATGHAVNLLRAPAGIMRVLQKGGGPLYDRALRIEQMLQDDTRTAFVTVAVPEELPVTELLELHEKLVALKAPIGPVILNAHVAGVAVSAVDDGVVDALLAHDATRAAAKDLRFVAAQARRSRRERDRLVDALKHRHGEALVVTLPARLDKSDELLAQRLADELARRLEVQR
jgi:anion-transporting  ArsA/GET3 family ATPase